MIVVKRGVVIVGYDVPGGEDAARGAQRDNVRAGDGADRGA